MGVPSDETNNDERTIRKGRYVGGRWWPDKIKWGENEVSETGIDTMEAQRTCDEDFGIIPTEELENWHRKLRPKINGQ